MPTRRTDFPTAVQRTLHILEKRDPYTLNKLAAEARLNFRTAKKVVEFLEQYQRFFKDFFIDVSSSDNLTVVMMKEKGLALYPENIQHLIVRTQYYPTISREEEILTHLLLHKATDETEAIDMQEDKKLLELLEAEHIAKSRDGRFYLTSDGQLIAKGALKLYPELNTFTFDKEREPDQVGIPWNIQMAIPPPPQIERIPK